MKKIYDYICYILTFLMLLSIFIFTVDFIIKLIIPSISLNINKIMFNSWREKAILCKRMHLIEDAIYAYENKKYSLSIPVFLSQLEGVIVKILQDDWSARAKDIITSFFISKIWLSTELRGRWNNKPKRSYITVDEIFQCPTAMKMLSDKNILPQCRKFGAKFCFTTQGLGQLKGLLTSIVDAGGSFMLLKGTKEEDFNLLKNKIENYEYEDIRDMAKTYNYPSLNLIYYSGGYASFISKLPPPIKNKLR